MVTVENLGNKPKNESILFPFYQLLLGCTTVTVISSYRVTLTGSGQWAGWDG